MMRIKNRIVSVIQVNNMQNIDVYDVYDELWTRYKEEIEMVILFITLKNYTCNDYKLHKLFIF